jgi:hypothetical protein
VALANHAKDMLAKSKKFAAPASLANSPKLMPAKVLNTKAHVL